MSEVVAKNEAPSIASDASMRFWLELVRDDFTLLTASISEMTLKEVTNVMRIARSLTSNMFVPTLAVHVQGFCMKRIEEVLISLHCSSPHVSLQESLKNFREIVEPIRELMREELEHDIRSIPIPQTLTLQEGQEIALECNDRVYSEGFRFRVPRTDFPGFLGYVKVGKREGEKERKPIFVVKGGNTTRTLGDDLAAVEIVPMGIDRRRHRVRTN